MATNTVLATDVSCRKLTSYDKVPADADDIKHCGLVSCPKSILTGWGLDHYHPGCHLSWERNVLAN